MSPVLIAGLFAGAVFLAGLGVTGLVVERSGVRESLRRLEGYQIQDVRDQEMLAPISERVVGPVLQGVGALAQRFTPEGYRDQVARKLVLAGKAHEFSVSSGSSSAG